MNKIISAQEARERTAQHIKNSQLFIIMWKIDEAINKGFHKIHVYQMADCVRTELESLGYEVRFYPSEAATDGREFWQISW